MIEQEGAGWDSENRASCSLNGVRVRQNHKLFDSHALSLGTAVSRIMAPKGVHI